VITLHELGDLIRAQTARSTEVQTANLLDAIGHFAWVKYSEQPPQQIESDRVQVGDTVIVYPGEQIPVDGIVIQGEAVVNQQSLNKRRDRDRCGTQRDRSSASISCQFSDSHS